jgi:hypothetical protein
MSGNLIRLRPNGMNAHFHSTERVHLDAFRYHSLDALRGVMMLLGIYLHAALACDGSRMP